MRFAKAGDFGGSSELVQVTPARVSADCGQGPGEV